MTGNLSIIGLLQYGKMKELDLFKNLTLPDGIDKDTLVNNILLKCNQLELLYPDFEFMQYMIGVWVNKNYWTFDKWSKVLTADYNPLDNYDRREEWTDTGTTDREGTGSGKNKQQDTTKTTELNQVNTYNDDRFHDESRQQVDSSASADGSTSSEYKDTTDDKNVHSGRIWGNIGVTTSMQLLESEIDFSRFNIYDQIASLFKSEFCLMIYN